MLKVFLGGEGRNDIGTRWDVPMGDEPGVAEVLLRRVRPSGWQVAAALRWRSIRKYKAGAGNQRTGHDDARNVQALVLHAYEQACEMLAFVRDVDGDEHRADAIRTAIAAIAELHFAEEFGYELAIVDGIPHPTLEGWILCLRGIADSDRLSPSRAERELIAMGIARKSTTDYVAVAETCALPTSPGSLREWLALAEATFGRLLDGVTPG